MGTDTFLVTTDLRDLTPVLVDNQGPLDHQKALNAVAAKRPDLAEIFAEPVFTRDNDGELVSATWYVSVDREARRLSQLPPARRERVETTLKEKLNSLAEAQSDPELAGLIAAISVVPDDQSVFAIGASPVIVNWGFKPKGDAVLVGSGLAVGALVASLATSGASAEVSAHDQEAAVDAEDAVVQGDTADGDEEAAIATGAVNGAGAVAGHAAGGAVAGAMAIQEPPHQRSWFRFLLNGLLVLLIIWLLWLLFRPHIDAWLHPPPSAAALHAPVLGGLEDERDRLMRLLDEDLCSDEALLEARRGPSVGSITPGDTVVPAPGDPEAGTPTPDGRKPAETAKLGGLSAEPQSAEMATGNQPIRLSELAWRLESSIAFILSSGDKGVSSGSGFFIANDTIMTNSHVVEGANNVYITSKHLRLAREARVVVQTPRPQPGKRDYAILKLEEPAENVMPLALSDELTKLDRVVAVGYPGALTRLDSQLKILLKGDATAAPEAIFTHGLVNVIFQDNQPNIIAHSADISQGNSGGPLVDECSRVVGINTFIGQDEKSGRRSKFSLVGSDMIAFLTENNVPFQMGGGRCGSDSTESQSLKTP